jgi:hypothetical protein
MIRAVYRILFVFLICLTPAAADNSGAEAPVTVNAEVNKTTAGIGDKIEYTITVNAPKDYEVELPSFGENLADFSVKDFTSDRGGFFSTTYTQKYTLDIYETGAFTIPAALIKYRENNSTEWKELITKDLSVTVQSLLNESDQTSGIKDIKGPYSMNNLMYLYIILAVIAVVAIIVALIIYMKKKKETREVVIPPPPAHETALNALRELMGKDYIRKGNIQEYYFELSNIVRHYLEDRFSMQAPEMTTEEFLVLLRDTDKLNADQKDLLRKFLSHCDMVKFAKHLPEEREIESSYEHAKRLIEQTKKITITGANVN